MLTARGEGIFPHVTAAAAVLLILMSGSIFIVVLSGAMPALKEFKLSFIFSTMWDPVMDIYGAAPALYGTAVSSFLALLVAAPLGVGTAVFLTELAPGWLRKPVSFMVELLAAVPSVVFGLWGILVLAPWLRKGVGLFLDEKLGFIPLFRGPFLGVGMLTGALVLAIMILPTVTAISREVMLTVPLDQREGMFALGATRWEMIRRIILPGSKAGIVGALLLGLGRAMGEAMAVTMVIGNAYIISPSLFSPAQTLSSLIVNEFPEAYDMQLAALMLLGLMLFAITLTINILALVMVNRSAARLKAGKDLVPLQISMPYGEGALALAKQQGTSKME
jgi:phosphate transport system permease protein